MLDSILKTSKSTRLPKLKNILRLITLLYFVWTVLINNFRHSYMLWNVFLAWIPLELASFLMNLADEKEKRRKYKVLIIVISLLWLLFYPNSPYIITDFIHLSSNKYYMDNPAYTPYSSLPRTVFNDDPVIWFDLFTIGVGVWIGYMTGFISLFINQRLVGKLFSRSACWCFVIVINFLSGFAIYLGRFIRWNSWDIIFNPKNILEILASDLHGRSFLFTVLFGVFNLVLYLINYQIVDLGIEN